MGTLGEYEFKVPSGTDEDVLYNVNIEEQHCDCYVGRTKQPCKHKALVCRTFKIKNFEVLDGKNTIMRSFWYYLGTGRKHEIGDDWFRNINEETLIDEHGNVDWAEDHVANDNVEDFNEPENENKEQDNAEDIDENEN